MLFGVLFCDDSPKNKNTATIFLALLLDLFTISHTTYIGILL